MNYSAVTMDNYEERNNKEQNNVHENKVSDNLSVIVLGSAGYKFLSVEVPRHNVVGNGRSDGVDECQ